MGTPGGPVGIATLTHSSVLILLYPGPRPILFSGVSLALLASPRVGVPAFPGQPLGPHPTLEAPSVCVSLQQFMETEPEMLAMETVVPVYFAVEDEALLSIYEQTQAASAAQGSASAAEGRLVGSFPLRLWPHPALSRALSHTCCAAASGLEARTLHFAAPTPPLTPVKTEARELLIWREGFPRCLWMV